ncbi:MAG: antitoxin [Planctomycetales bacterium 71-10]|nr:MAG: antitoxin [Planctomycetales bacterium 71-10]
MWQDRIAIDPAVLVGKPVIRGTRLAVEFLLDLLAESWTHEQILQNYPQLTEDDIHAALHYAVEALKRERIFPLAV